MQIGFSQQRALALAPDAIRFAADAFCVACDDFSQLKRRTFPRVRSAQSDQRKQTRSGPESRKMKSAACTVAFALKNQRRKIQKKRVLLKLHQFEEINRRRSKQFFVCLFSLGVLFVC